MLAVAGVTAMLTMVAAGTVTVVLAVLPLKLAFMTLLPKAAPVTRPPLATVTEAGVTETKLLPLVTLTLLPSEYVASTANWRVAATGTMGFCGVTAIDSKVAGLTVKTVLAVSVPVVAVICVVPATLPSARPLALMLAVAGVADTG